MIKDLIAYLKYKKEINDLYSFSLKGKYGEQVGEDYNWRERLDYWRRSE
jgi:hypothetical protein